MLVGGGGQFQAQQVPAETRRPPGQSSGAKFLMSDNLKILGPSDHLAVTVVLLRAATLSEGSAFANSWLVLIVLNLCYTIIMNKSNT